jgi:SMODS-associating 2TM, beta-strand rich effector domain
MHPYAADAEERKWALIAIVLASVTAAYLTHAVVDLIGTPPWWMEIPSVLGSFGILYSLFNRVLWRLRSARALRLVRIPDLIGNWQGVVQSGVAQYAAQQHNVEVDIRQTWTHISIRVDAEQSHSNSLSGMVLTHGAAGATLIYEYLNEPKPSAVPTMEAHRGTARCLLGDAWRPDRIRAEYYSGRGRQGFGSMTLTRL